MTWKLVTFVLGVQILWVLVVAWLLASGVRAAGVEFDRKCVKGRLSAEQAEAISRLPWEKCPRYRHQPDGTCLAGPQDRVIHAECADFIRGLTFRDVWFIPEINFIPDADGGALEVEF